MAKNNDEAEAGPSPEMVMAYKAMVCEILSLAQLTLWCGQRINSARIHRTERNCLVIPAMASSLLFIETQDNEVAIGVQPGDAPIFDSLPMVSICIKNHELFFVTREVTFNGIIIEPFALSFGQIIYNDLVEKFLLQPSSRFFEVKIDTETDDADNNASLVAPLLNNKQIPLIVLEDETTNVISAWELLLKKMARSGSTKQTASITSHFS